MDLLPTPANRGNTGFGETPTENRPIFKKFGLNSLESLEQVVFIFFAFVMQLKSSAADGRRGYVMTFMVAYIRDIVMDYYFVAESFGMLGTVFVCSGMCLYVGECICMLGNVFVCWGMCLYVGECVCVLGRT